MPEPPSSKSDRFPRRIVCLTEETTETLYLLGEEDRIVGISGFTVRPPEARMTKPRVSLFTSAKTDEILALEPDLILGFSDLQADIATDLVRAGLNVMIFNQRSVEEILGMIQTLGSMVGAGDRAARLVTEIEHGIAAVRSRSESFEKRPRVYFEEWDDPMISGIRWVSELISIAGGDDCFPELCVHPHAVGRIVTDPEEVIRRAPDIIVGSWCGKMFKPDKVRVRPGWEAIPAVRDDQLHEIRSSEILQPGPAALTDGLRGLHGIFERWQQA